MLSPKTAFSHMNVFRTEFGERDGIARLGSLDFLSSQPRLIGAGTAQHVDEDTGQPDKPLEPMDLVIMNPPFTRDSLRHDQFPRAVELKIKGREKEILEDQPHRSAARLHSSGGMFAVLGERMIKPKRGALALILPSVVPTGPGNQALRQYLADKFQIETIVSSHDPERIYMSENTSIGEVLIVCRRWNSQKPKPETRVINLAENPETPMKSLDLAHRLAQGDTGAFTVQSVDADRIAQGDWNAVNFFSPFLTQAYRLLSDQKPPLPLTRMSAIADVGPEGRRVRDAYTRSDTPTASGRRALWEHKTAITQSMRGKTDKYIEPKKDKKSLANKYWQQRSHLLLPHRLWLPLARVCAVMLDQPAVGSIWTPCRPHDQDRKTMKALAVFLNSSVGILSLLGGRDNRKPSYPQFSLDTLRALRVPDFTTISTDARDALATTYDCHGDDVLLPLPQINVDPVRRRLEDAVTAALGLDAEWVAQVRQALSKEPSITNRRFGT